jgi:nitroimidazol reductase NimA-like FMN-containing flavoprotein (pyridoxamine 5'-phosphate oxidase superfamily)
MPIVAKVALPNILLYDHDVSLLVTRDLNKMSNAPQLRRTDRLMPQEETLISLQEGYCGRLTTIGPDGYPYCVPLLYVLMDAQLFMHGTAARGHLRASVENNRKVCFEIDSPGEVFDYGRFECDTGLAYRSVVVFGQISIVDDIPTKQRFCENLMAKYGKPDTGRPKGFFPRLMEICVYAIAIERITGKELALPPVSKQWPAMDRTKTPFAQP